MGWAAAPHFVPAPARNTDVAMPAAVAGLTTALLNAQVASARIPGGQWEKKNNQVLLYPDEEGFTDGQVAFCLVIALVTGIFAINFAVILSKGFSGELGPAAKKKKNYGMTPLKARYMANGYRGKVGADVIGRGIGIAPGLANY